MMNKIVMATNNANKLREVREILSPLGIDVISQAEAGISCDPEENGSSFSENSEIKAKAVYNAYAEKKHGNIAVIADDSGLCVDVLDGRPGVYSSRYAPKGQECTRLLDEMNDIPDERRTARFICDITYINVYGEDFHFEGICEGRISREKLGENGFGYDPVFMYGGRTLAEMTSEEKNNISHRAKALGSLYKFLKERQGE